MLISPLYTNTYTPFPSLHFVLILISSLTHTLSFILHHSPPVLIPTSLLQESIGVTNPVHPTYIQFPVYQQQSPNPARAPQYAQGLPQYYQPNQQYNGVQYYLPQQYNLANQYLKGWLSLRAVSGTVFSCINIYIFFYYYYYYISYVFFVILSVCC